MVFGTGRRALAVMAVMILVAGATLPGPTAGRPPRVVRVYDCYPNAAFAPDGKVLACGLALREVMSGKQLGAGKPGEKVPPCTCVAFSPDGQRFASVHFDRGLTSPRHALCLWNRAGDGQVREATTLLHAEDQQSRYEESLHYLAFSPDGRMLATRLPGDRTVVWDIASGKERLRLETNGLAVAFTPDGRALTSVSRSGLVQHWDLANGKRLDVAEASPRRDFLFVCRAVASADGKTLAISDRHSVVIKDGQTGKTLRRFDDVAADCLARSDYHAEGCLALSADGKTLAVADGGVRLLNTATGKETGRLRELKESVYALAFSPDGKFLAVGLRRSVEVWETADLARAGKSRRGGGSRPPLEATVIPRKGAYRLALGGKTAEEFARQVEPGKPLPPSPEVDLILSLRNTSDKTLTLPREGTLDFSLVGEGALNHPGLPYQTGFTLDERPLELKQITLAPGESYEVPIRSLDNGHSKQSYWLVPGEYTLHARYSTWVKPAPEGWDQWEDERGYGTLRATPLRLRVEAEAQ